MRADDHCFFAFKVEPQKERAARLILKQQHFACCVPMKRVKRRIGPLGRSGPYKEIKTIAAPGYVFVCLPAHEPPIHRVTRFRAIRPPVMFDGQPAKISKAAFAMFLRHLGEKPHEVAPQVFRKGDSVRISSGPGMDRIGKIAEMKGDRLILELMGAILPLSVRRDQVEPASSDGVSTNSQKALTVRRKSLRHAA